MVFAGIGQRREIAHRENADSTMMSSTGRVQGKQGPEGNHQVGETEHLQGEGMAATTGDHQAEMGAMAGDRQAGTSHQEGKSHQEGTGHQEIRTEGMEERGNHRRENQIDHYVTITKKDDAETGTNAITIT